MEAAVSPGRSLDSAPLASDPIDVGGHRLANRLVMTPHLARLPASRFLEYLSVRLPGPGMVITPAGSPVYAASPYPEGIGVLPATYCGDSDAVLPRPAGTGAEVARTAWEQPAAFVGRQARLAHAAGSVLIGQLHHPGAERSWDSFQPTIAPSAIDGEGPAQRPHELTDAEIERLIADYAINATWVVDAGADGVEVHAAHGYLLNRFLSPYYNRRTGRYGGDAAARWAVLREILQGIRAAVGPAPILGVRLPAFELMPGGLAVEDVVAGAQECASWLSYVNLSIGNHDGLAGGRPVLAYTTPWLVPRPDLMRCAIAVREATRLPVLATGGVHRAADVTSLLGAGADLVGIARAAIADPAFARKVLAGRGGEVAECIGCNECTAVPFSCPVNPAAGRELELRVTAAVRRRAVAIVGGGPAGLAAGLAAAARGHRVALYDRAEVAGGRLADLVRDPVRARWVPWLQRMTALAAESIELHLGAEVTAAQLGELCADVVVLATGSVPAAVDFDDDGSVPVLTSTDVLRGQRPAGDAPVLVVGGTEPHLDPLLTARLLAVEGRAVHVISELVTVAPSVEPRTLNHLLATLAMLDVAVATSTRLAGLSRGMARTAGLLTGRVGRRAVGAIVLAQARTADPHAARLAGAGRAGQEIHVVGDALAPRRLAHAALEGARFGTSI